MNDRQKTADDGLVNEEVNMTNFTGGEPPLEEPMADVAEQQRSADAADDAALDVDYVSSRTDADANPADVIEQAIDVPLLDDDRPGPKE
jgi:hypothetical protein